MIVYIILLCIAYIFGGVGYIITIKHLDATKLKDNKFIITILFISWPFWLTLLGLAATMTELEWQAKKMLR